MRKWLVPAATGIAGLVAGFLLAGAGTEPERTSAIFPGATGIPVIAAQAADPVTLDDLRRVVREELAALPGGSAGTPAARANDPDDGMDTAAQASAASQAHAVLDSALSRRSWTDSDREALQPQFVLMSAAQRDEWLLQYAQAVNQGRLVPEGERAPF